MTRTLEEIWPPYGIVVESGDLRTAERRGVPTPEVLFELRPEDLVRGDDPVRITGAGELRRFLGLG